MRGLIVRAAVFLGLLALAPFAAAQPAGAELDGLIELLQQRVVSIEGLQAPAKPEKKTLKLIKKALVKLNKPSTSLSKDAKSLRAVVPPLQNKLADDIPVQQELVIAAAQVLVSCEASLLALETEFEGIADGPQLTKAMKLHAKGVALLVEAAATEPLKKRVSLLAKSAKRAELSGAKAAQAQPPLPDGCFGTPLALNESVNALLAGEPWSPTAVSASLTYAPDGVTIVGFGITFLECPDNYRWISYSLSVEPVTTLTYTTYVGYPSALTVTASADDDSSDGITTGLYLGGVGIKFTHFDPVNQSAVGTFYGFMPEPPPSFASQQLSNGEFNIQGFTTYVQGQ